MTSEKNMLLTELLTSPSKFTIKLGLERILLLLDKLNNPQNDLNVIHVAGTNGKGSVCTVISEILKQSGYKTGLYTSPHLHSYTERFKINGADISEEKLYDYVLYAEKTAIENDIGVTEFELLTAAAFLWFRDEKTDFAVLETGLGGRFDATNVVEKPVLSVITSISVDHKDRLGDTVEKIAFEKAGIIKKAPVVISDKNQGLSIIKKVAAKKKSEVLKASKCVSVSFENNINYVSFDDKKYEYGILGLKQSENIKLITEAVDNLRKQGIEIPEDAFSKGLKNAFIPARMQYIKDKNVLLDGAHNVEAIKGLKENLDFYFPEIPRGWVFGSISTKEYDKNVNILFEKGDEVLLTSFDHPFAVPPEDIYKKITHTDGLIFKNLSKSANILKIFSPDRLIIFTGSFYMIGQMPYFPQFVKKNSIV